MLFVQNCQLPTKKTSSWYAKGPGMVKTETYDARGKLSSYTLLTDYSK
ncbi:TapB family protein [Botryobacter ruber]|nr:hypothetical protein [Botryobacter ruber]